MLRRPWAAQRASLVTAVALLTSGAVTSVTIEDVGSSASPSSLPSYPGLSDSSTSANMVPGKTIGNGVILRNQQVNVTSVVFEHNVSQEAAFGVMTHFWNTGSATAGARDQNYCVDELLIDYYIDGEEEPSISFQPSMASGEYYAGKTQEQNFPPYGLFNAGEKMGKNAQVGGWYNYYKIPFQTSIRVTVRTLSHCQDLYVVVRGHEVPKNPDGTAPPHLEIAPGFTVPSAARLQLHRIENKTFQPLSFVPILEVAAGNVGRVYLVSLAVSTSPAANAWIEGCWHLYDANESFPGLVLGTGLEDFFDSAYTFCTSAGQPCLFAHPSAGLLHFDRSNSSRAGSTSEMPATFERLSMYRFLDQESVAVRNGGRLEWRVGDVTGKCNTFEGRPGGTSPVTLTSYAWVYVWPSPSPGPTVLV